MPVTNSPSVTSRWRALGEGEVAAAEIDALGTRVRVVVWPSDRLESAALAVGSELHRLDKEASRFRDDSEISRLHAQGGGLYFISEGLAEVIGVALAAARFTDGLVDPTVGSTLVELGYDRDFAAMTTDVPSDVPAPEPAPGYHSVSLEGRLLRVPPGVLLDIGATAKGLGADRAALAALDAIGDRGGVLVSLGGDITVAGEPPIGGWPIVVNDSADASSGSGSQIVRLAAGAVATSSRTTRQWQRAGQTVHHIIDPRTGLPANGPWRTATVVAATCAEANAASTAAIVGGTDAVSWLRDTGLPARLVTADGAVHRFGAWPEADGGIVTAPSRRMSAPVPTLLRSSR
ncbi:MAG: FAD:protein FMN transferase [Acidimicrobiales bacterium]